MHGLVQAPPEISFDLSGIRAEVLTLAQQVWQHRAETERRSAQIMARFLTELLGSGEPAEVCALTVDLINDELQHVQICHAVCEALQVEPTPIKNPVLQDPEGFLAMPMPIRAVATTLTMLVISESISTLLIEDLAARCENHSLRNALQSTSADEAQHRQLGWAFLDHLLTRLPSEERAQLPELVRLTLQPHEAAARSALAAIPSQDRHLNAFPEPHLAMLGLLSRERQSLLYLRARDERLRPGLEARRLWPTMVPR